MKTTISRSALAVVLATTATVGAAQHTSARQPHHNTGAPDASIIYWDQVGTAAAGAAGLSPPEGFALFGYVAIAVYDSVMAIEGGYQPFTVDIDAPDGASAEAAVAASARAVLVHHFPSQAASLQAAYTAALESIADGESESDGVAVGEAVASQFLAGRDGDGFRAPATYTPPAPPVPGVWIPTATTPALAVSLGDMRPFSLRSADQFAPKGPPALNSRRWVEDYNEVREIGSRTSATRTAAQTAAAVFWAEAPLTQARGAFRNFIDERDLDIVDAARYMAMVSVTQADVIIACFNAKYHEAFWRPVTAIRAGDSDGNPSTEGDPNWLQLLGGTPNHPEYPSAHSCLTPAAAQVAVRFLGTQHINFLVPSVAGNPDRRFATAHALADEVANARIWGGIHFRTAVEDGSQLGKRVANYVLAHHFHPSPK